MDELTIERIRKRLDEELPQLPPLSKHYQRLHKSLPEKEITRDMAIFFARLDAENYETLAPGGPLAVQVDWLYERNIAREKLNLKASRGAKSPLNIPVLVLLR